MDWQHMEKLPQQHNMGGIKMEFIRANKAGETVSKLEKNKAEGIKDDTQDLGLSKENSPKKSEIENSCIGPILHKKC